jgi:hypothetical protein
MLLKDMQLCISASSTSLLPTDDAPNPLDFIPRHRQKTHSAWQTILSFFSLKEIIRVQ